MVAKFQTMPEAMEAAMPRAFRAPAASSPARLAQQAAAPTAPRLEVACQWAVVDSWGIERASRDTTSKPVT